MPKTTPRAARSKSKPAKPYPGFPLFPHATGRWAKKILHKFHCFGKIADDPKGEQAPEQLNREAVSLGEPNSTEPGGRISRRAERLSSSIPATECVKFLPSQTAKRSSISDNPTKTAALAAVRLLFDVVVEFPFAKPEHRAASRLTSRSQALLWDFAPWHPSKIRQQGWQIPAERLNKHYYS